MIEIGAEIRRLLVSHGTGSRVATDRKIGDRKMKDKKMRPIF